MKLTDKDFQLMNEILKFILFHQSKSYTNEFLAEKLSIDTRTTRFLFNKVCELASNENILVVEKANSGDYAVVRVNELRLNHFIESGGFKAYKKSSVKNMSFISRIFNNPWLLLIVSVILAAIFNTNRIMNVLNRFVDRF